MLLARCSWLLSFPLHQLITSDVVNTSLAIVGMPPYSPLCRYSAFTTMCWLIGNAQPRRQRARTWSRTGVRPSFGRSVGSPSQTNASRISARTSTPRKRDNSAGQPARSRRCSDAGRRRGVRDRRERPTSPSERAAQLLGPEPPPAPRHLQVGAREPHRVGAVERAILRAVHARHAQLDAHGQRQRDRQPAAGGLAGVAVDLVVEVKLLGRRRSVGQRAGDDSQSLSPNLLRNLMPSGVPVV